MRSTLIVWAAIGGGLAISSLLIPGQWVPIILLGLIAGFLPLQLASKMAAGKRELYSPKAKYSATWSVGIYQGMGLTMGALALAGFWLMSRDDVFSRAPAWTSGPSFVLAAIVGIGLYLGLNARKLGGQRAPDWPSAEEAP